MTPAPDDSAPATGATEPAGLRLRVSAGNASGEVIEVRDELEIGREADGVGRLAGDAEISRRHARIARSGPGYSVEDLGSTNGTLLNGRKVEKPELLGVGDELQVGATTLIVQVSAPTTPPAPAAEPEPVEMEPAPEAGPVVPPRLAFRVEFDFEAGEARIQLEEGSDSVRLVLEDGAWRMKPQD